MTRRSLSSGKGAHSAICMVSPKLSMMNPEACFSHCAPLTSEEFGETVKTAHLWEPQ